MRLNCKRIVFILLLSGILLSLRFFYGFYSVSLKGKITRFDGGYTRLDAVGGEEEAEKALKELSASVLKTENAGGSKIIYAYSPLIYKSKTVNGQKVNVMVSINGGNLVLGIPLIKGSF